MSIAICVFCSSSNTVDPAFFRSAQALGGLIAGRGHSLVFGGTNVGLMGEVANATKRGGGRVIGVLPRAFSTRNMTFDLADEVIVTHDLRERKALMESRAEAFVALPGGYGTLEEVLEILTLKQLQFHSKPVVLLNTNGFYDHLVQFFDRLHAENFTRADNARLYQVAATPEAALDYIEQYQPATTPGEWF